MPEAVTRFIEGLSTPALIALVLILVVQLILQVWAVFDLVRRDAVRFNAKWLWLIIIFTGSVLGPLIYFGLGRVTRPRDDSATGRPPAERGKVEAGVSRLYRDQDRQ